MTAFQSTLGEEEDGIAAKLAENQREISIAEFFEKNKHMLGFDSAARALVTATKEAVDNSLDAIEEAGLLPDIYVEIVESDGYYRVIVEDNGPGITKEQIPKVFGKLLYGSRFHVREQSLLPDQHVMLKRGDEVRLRPIESLCERYLPPGSDSRTVPISDDIQVPCFDRETGDIDWHDVTHVIRHETESESVEIETTAGRTIGVTTDHSLFTLSKDGTIEEVAGADLEPGDHLVVPATIPSIDACDRINVLEHVPTDSSLSEELVVHGVDRAVIRDVSHAMESVSLPVPGTESTETVYRLGAVEIPAERLESDCLSRRQLPASVVIALGWEDRVANGTIRLDRDHPDSIAVPVTFEPNRDTMRDIGRMLAHAIAGTRARRPDGVDAADSNGIGRTIVDVDEPRIPEFVFRTGMEYQRAFLDGLHSIADRTTDDVTSITTDSERFARELAYLWTLCGRTATVSVHPSGPTGDGAGRRYTVSVVTGEGPSSGDPPTGLPASLFADNPAGEPSHRTVPSTAASVLGAIGLGDGGAESERIHEAAMATIDTGRLPTGHPGGEPLRSAGFVTDDGEPTDRLREVLQRCDRIERFGDSDLELLEVTSVERVPSPDVVYDLSVPGTGADENFVAGNRGPICVKNSRGQQGIGISAAVLYSQLTSGKPAKITSRTQGSASAQYFELIIDTDDNEPNIKTETTTAWDRPHGTRIELEMEANMRARSQLHDYIKHTAVVNPHARIEFHEPEGSWKFERATDTLPAETESIRPHPHGVELGTVIKMLSATTSHSVSGFLREEFSRVGRKTADSILDAFRDNHFGREMAWSVPEQSADIEAAVARATANKTAEATDSFAAGIATGLDEYDRVTHSELVELVGRSADRIESEFGETFGETVRENAVDAAWSVITDRREEDLYRLVTEVTSNRKDDATIRGMAERLASKFGSADDPRDRATRRTIERYVDRTANMTEEIESVTIGDTARSNVVEGLWSSMRTVPDDVPKVRTVASDREMASDLVEAMRSVDVMAPPTSCLSPITEELIEAGLRKEFDAEFFGATTRGAGVHAGDPFVVEAGIAYGGALDPEGAVDVLRFANRVPLVYQRGACATTDVVKSIGWRNYGLDQPGGSGMPNGPAVILVHVASTNVPFTSESKDAIANVPEIEDEIELAIRDAARDMKAFLNKRRSLQKRKQKQSALATILPRMAEKVAEVTDREMPNIDDAMARIMNNVLVERQVENGTVRVVIENHRDSNETIEVTDILSTEPADLSDGARAMEMDGEWFVQYSATVPSGESAVLEYRIEADDPTSNLAVSGIEDEKLTVIDSQ